MAVSETDSMWADYPWHLALFKKWAGPKHSKEKDKKKVNVSNAIQLRQCTLHSQYFTGTKYKSEFAL